MPQIITLTLRFMVFCAATHVGAQTPPALRTAPLPTPAQRIEAAQNRSNAEADSALAQLNAYRKAMGLSVLTANNALTVAALRHSLYRSVILAENKEAENFDVNGTPGSHFQMVQNPFFTGKTLKDRVILEGYTANANEVSTSGSRKSGAEFIHQMIASVYHRSGVLDFQWDEAGFGVIDKEPVMVLGASRKGVDAPVQPVVFPPPDSVIEPIAFKNERPDPWPERAAQWKGLPISIHAAKGQVLDIRKFELLNEAGQVLAGRLLTHGNDKRLGKNEAYWVPYAPLQFGQTYRPSISYGLAGRAQEVSWTRYPPPAIPSRSSPPRGWWPNPQRRWFSTSEKTWDRWLWVSSPAATKSVTAPWCQRWMALITPSKFPQLARRVAASSSNSVGS